MAARWDTTWGKKEGKDFLYVCNTTHQAAVAAATLDDDDDALKIP